jgi:hypothetical protein
VSYRKAPKVVTGMASPVTATADPEALAKESINDQVEQARRLSQVPKRNEGEVVFQSRFPGYRFQVKAIRDRKDPETGEVIAGQTLAAQFIQGEYRTSDPLVIKRLKGSKDYGIGRDFWDAEEMRVAAQTRSIETLAETVKKSGDLEMIKKVVDELLPMLNADKEFKLPSQPSAEEIAAVEQAAGAEA